MHPSMDRLPTLTLVRSSCCESTVSPLRTRIDTTRVLAICHHPSNSTAGPIHFRIAQSLLHSRCHDLATMRSCLVASQPASGSPHPARSPYHLPLYPRLWPPHTLPGWPAFSRCPLLFAGPVSVHSGCTSQYLRSSCGASRAASASALNNPCSIGNTAPLPELNPAQLRCRLAAP